jgi:predicted PurR-regulated permease PerM
MRWVFLSWSGVLLVWVLYRNQATLTLLGISFGIAYLLDPTVDRLAQLGVPRSLAIILIGLVILLGCGMLVLIVIPQIYVQAQYVIARLPAWWWWLSAHLDPILDYLPPAFADKIPSAFDEAHLQKSLQQLWDWVGVDFPKVIQRVLGIVKTMFTGLAKFILGK